MSVEFSSIISWILHSGYLGEKRTLNLTERPSFSATKSSTDCCHVSPADFRQMHSWTICEQSLIPNGSLMVRWKASDWNLSVKHLSQDHLNIITTTKFPLLKYLQGRMGPCYRWAFSRRVPVKRQLPPQGAETSAASAPWNAWSGSRAAMSLVRLWKAPVNLRSPRDARGVWDAAGSLVPCGGQ